MTDRIRVASCQYYIRPIKTFSEFRDQVVSLIETAHDYRCKLLVFPEYFSVQLLTTLGNLHAPIDEQVRHLAGHRDFFVELFTEAVRGKGMYVVAGTFPTWGENERLHNDAYVFGPDGRFGVQGKMHMTRWEREEWMVTPRRGLKIFETEIGKMAVAICYDVEFPEVARAAAKDGCYLLIVPSCTDDRQGFLRVRYCAQARAIENQMYVIHSSTVGSIPMVPAVSLNYGQASILTPSDFAFARDGILAEGLANQEQIIVGELNMDTIRESRERGTVLPLRDSMTTAEVLGFLENVRL
ncbi:MAG: carbon-nitrogen hydrolase family protein [Phycisphaerae bacterium]